ncbi:hypothetical protein T439DRAFT_302437 [Meredithblackwellia eburnea MCA 4105]
MPVQQQHDNNSFESINALHAQALQQAISQFRSLISKPHSSAWKQLLPTTSSAASSASNSATSSSSTSTSKHPSKDQATLVQVHKRKAPSSPSAKSGGGPGTPSAGSEVVRASYEFTLDSNNGLDDWKSVFSTPEVRANWDKMVEQAHTVEVVDNETIIEKTDYRIGWPASPRDTVTIHRVLSDQQTVVSIATSLPRSKDEPAFLRPAPPFVRSQVGLLAWSLQVLPPSSTPSSTSSSAPQHPLVASSSASIISTASSSTTTLVPTPSSSSSAATLTANSSSTPAPLRAKLTLHHQWSHRSSTPIPTHATYQTLLPSLVSFVKNKAPGIPHLKSWGKGIEVGSVAWERGSDVRVVDYCVVASEDPTDPSTNGTPSISPSSIANSTINTNSTAEEGPEKLRKERERNRLERSVEVALHEGGGGWDIRLGVKGVGEGVKLGWTVLAEREVFEGTPVSGSRCVVRFKHEPVDKVDWMVRASLTVQRLPGGKGIKVNGESVEIVNREVRDLTGAGSSAVSGSGGGGGGGAGEGGETFGDWDSSSFSLGGSVGGGISDLWDDTSTIDSRRTSSGSSTTGSILTVPPQPPIPPQSTASSTIRSLLRRNYIYFTSLLQEPEAKWRHVSDSHGVTVTQLNSIDPTLTIYRAEATFVGVGVWDVFATVCTPGVRAVWDKLFEEASLVEDVSELSEVWWSKIKGSWPVAPRDSVTLRTAYKSPSSVHIFSFSTDDTNLFPTLPPVLLPTIRTQTSLYGWAIEALSPTTTQLTLLDQSDPKGWSNKSWTPAQMIAAVSGVGEFSIKQGGPPVVTRLVGAKKMEEKYEVEKGALRVEYRLGERILEGPQGQEWDNSGVPAAAIVEAGGGGDSAMGGMVECEIRCDSTTWATSIDLVIDPPPSRFSCLSRHRLSSGGGMWITIEHEARSVKEERIMVVVKKGTAGREKNSVTVNGSRVRVDVESLAEDEVKLLSKRKRVKASPIPLDQYSTHGPRVWRTPSVNSTSSRSRTGSPAPEIAPSSSNPVPIPSTSKITSTSSSASAANGTATSHVENGDAAAARGSGLSASPLSQAPVFAEPIAAPSTPKGKADVTPATAALEALSWLQTFHAEQGPELTDPAPGWSIHSERSGTTVRKKIIPAVSDVFPVYRGDRIVQGLTADEIASVVSAVGCRKAWDERVESAISLASYGNGLSTSVQMTKPAFPFKGRIFHVATVNAHVRVPSASASASTTTVLFSASASYTPDGTFDQAKVNPSGLLEGQILLEGWILETLDPYSSSVLAIPSTRCTYVACIDHAGSVPLALNSVLNANLTKLIGAVENLGKTKGPLPRVWTPDAGLQIEGPLSEDGDQECVWKLSNVQPSSVLLSSDLGIEESTFRALFHVSGPPPPPKTPAVMNLASSKSALITPSTPVGTMLKSELPRSASLNFGLGASVPILSKPSELARKLSSGSLRSQATTAVTGATSTGIVERRSKSPPPSILNGVGAAAVDLVVAELIIDLKQYPNGYSIACSSSLNLDKAEPLSIEPLRSLATRQVPLRATAHDAPLPPILSASLDASKRTNHLVRIIIPTSAFTHPVQDPLRDGKLRDAKPEWFNKLVEHGALVDVRILPLPPDASVKGDPKSRVTFNGETLTLASQKESRAVLSRLEDEDWHPSCAKISRVPRKKKTGDSDPLSPAPLPAQLSEPAAVAVRLLAPKVETPVLDEEFPDPKSPGSMTPNHEEDGSKSPAPTGAKTIGPSTLGVKREHASSDASATGPLLGILGAYPLSRLSSSMTTTTVTKNSTSEPTVQRTYTLTFVLLACLISFLLGSLLRSLLTPADYIIYNRHQITTEGEQMERALMQAFNPERRWREARRLLEIRSFFFSKWDLIFAAVRRG